MTTEDDDRYDCWDFEDEGATGEMIDAVMFEDDQNDPYLEGYQNYQRPAG